VSNKQNLAGIQRGKPLIMNTQLNFTGKSKIDFFSLAKGGKAKKQKKPPAGLLPAFHRCTFFFDCQGQSKKYQKRNPWPTHGLARNFATKLPPKNSLEKYRQVWYSLKLSRATS
jgi:hypothetical protein